MLISESRQSAVEREEQVEGLLGAHLADDDPARSHARRYT